ncbi:hypothetical protein [Streptomyces sp. NPDC058953]|uniref:hypothetical protein n=1 Tax=unclassified Streptomyces TaxID=2593676 RepID=UPI0036BF9B2B
MGNTGEFTGGSRLPGRADRETAPHSVVDGGPVKVRLAVHRRALGLPAHSIA